MDVKECIEQSGEPALNYLEPLIMWQKTFDAIEDKIFILSPDFKIIEANKAFIKSCNIKRENIIGSKYHQWIHKSSIPVMEDIFLAALQIKRLFIKEYTEDDEIFELICYPIFDKNQNIEYFTLFIKNTTERKRAESVLLNAKEKAKESNHLKAAFLQNLSHEIRTPLNAIVGFSQLLASSDGLPHNLHQYTSIILDKSARLIDIINDVIEISKIQALQIGKDSSWMDIVKFTGALVLPFFDKGKAKNVPVIFNQNIPADKYVINSDSEKLNKIFTHLIDNALKFTHQGSVEITIEIVNSDFKFSVTDTGIGISEEMQKVIFEPFRQLDNNLARNYNGNGLGLAIVKAYVELLNGNISLKSEINIGTTFYVTIPVEHTPLQEPGTNEKKNSPEQVILIVEDELINYLYLKKILEGSGYRTLYANNGLQAIDLCRNNNPIHLVFMDIIMPVMDGYTATKLLKEFLPGLKIIAQTSLTHFDEKMILSNGFDDYIPKPINKDILNRIVTKHLNNNSYGGNMLE